MMDLSIVRLGEPEDEHDLMAMARAMHEESPLRNAQGQPLFFSDAKARAMIRNALYVEGGRSSWVGIIGERDRLQGSICLSIFEPSTFSHEQFLDSTWNFVVKEFRATSLVARTLQAFAEQAADRLGIPLLVKSLGEHAGRKSFYERVSKCQPFGNVLLYSAKIDSALAGA